MLRSDGTDETSALGHCEEHMFALSRPVCSRSSDRCSVTEVMETVCMYT